MSDHKKIAVNLVGLNAALSVARLRERLGTTAEFITSLAELREYIVRNYNGSNAQELASSLNVNEQWLMQLIQIATKGNVDQCSFPLDAKPSIKVSPKMAALFQQLQPIPPQEQRGPWAREQAQRLGVTLDTIYRSLVQNGVRVERKSTPDQVLKECYQLPPEDVQALLQSPLLANPAFLAALKQSQQTTLQACQQNRNGCMRCSALASHRHQTQTLPELSLQAFSQAAATYFRRLTSWSLRGLKK